MVNGQRRGVFRRVVAEDLMVSTFRGVGSVFEEPHLRRIFNFYYFVEPVIPRISHFAVDGSSGWAMVLPWKADKPLTIRYHEAYLG